MWAGKLKLCDCQLDTLPRNTFKMWLKEPGTHRKDIFMHENVNIAKV